MATPRAHGYDKGVERYFAELARSSSGSGFAPPPTGIGARTLTDGSLMESPRSDGSDQSLMRLLETKLDGLSTLKPEFHSIARALPDCLDGMSDLKAGFLALREEVRINTQSMLQSLAQISSQLKIDGRLPTSNGIPFSNGNQTEIDMDSIAVSMDGVANTVPATSHNSVLQERNSPAYQCLPPGETSTRDEHSMKSSAQPQSKHQAGGDGPHVSPPTQPLVARLEDVQALQREQIALVDSQLSCIREELAEGLKRCDSYQNPPSAYEMAGQASTTQIMLRPVHSGSQSSLIPGNPRSFYLRPDVDVDDIDCGIQHLDSTPLSGAFGRIFVNDNYGKLDEPAYHVEDLYKKTGWAQKIALSHTFSILTTWAIIANSVYIGVDIDFNKSNNIYQAEWEFFVFQHVFSLFFMFELFVRFMAFREWRAAFSDGWFRFDFALVMVMSAELYVSDLILYLTSKGRDAVTFPSPAIRLLRLARLCRVLRLGRVFPELIMMLQALGLAARAVLASLLLVTVMVYIAAIIMNVLAKEFVPAEGKENQFRNIPRAMWTMFTTGTLLLGDAEALLTPMLLQGNTSEIIAAFVFLAFVVCCAVTIMNMLVGILVEVVGQTGKSEREAIAISTAKHKILPHLQLRADEKNCISQPDLIEVMEDQSAREVLLALDVNRLFLLELQKMLFPPEVDHVPIRVVMEMMLMCRGANKVTVKILASSLLYISNEINGIPKLIQSLQEALTANLARLQHTIRHSRRNAYHHTHEATGDESSPVQEQSDPIVVIKKQCRVD